jgi:FixJ family two-component response regulator
MCALQPTCNRRFARYWAKARSIEPQSASARRAPSSFETLSEDDKSHVVVVDDDVSVREALQGLLGSVGLKVEAFASAQECLTHMDPEGTACLVLDVRLPGKSGLDLHDELKRADIPVPVVFISGYNDIRMSVRAMKAGAVEFLPKPFGEQELLDAIQLAIEQNRKVREARKTLAALHARWSTLTAREREVMAGVVKGLRNKAVASSLGVSEVTVKAHRRKVMTKMSAQTLPDLVRMSDLLSVLI